MKKTFDQLSIKACTYADEYGEKYDAIWFQFYNEKFASLITAKDHEEFIDIVKEQNNE